MGKVVPVNFAEFFMLCNLFLLDISSNVTSAKRYNNNLPKDFKVFHPNLFKTYVNFSPIFQEFPNVDSQDFH